MSEKRIDIDVTNIVPVNIPKDIKSEDKIEFERSPELVEMELERERQIAQAMKLFEEGGFTYGESVDDEGNEIIAIYTNKDSTTPLQKLIELCEADLPYVDEKTRQDYEQYLKDMKVEEIEYDPFEKKRELEDLFG